MGNKSRQQQLQNWVARTLDDDCIHFEPLSGDAGFRRYYRLGSKTVDGAKLLAVDAPVETENSALFYAIARQWRGYGVPTPRVFYTDFDQGFMIIEDFGRRLLSDVLSLNNADEYYGRCIELLIDLQSHPLAELSNANDIADRLVPDYDIEKLRSEMQLFEQWMLPELLGLTVSDTDLRLLDSVQSLLIESAIAQPQVWVHRDFHCRNIVVSDDDALGVIDFQDAVRGPITYDLVSLLKDCYLRWSPELVEHWSSAYYQKTAGAGLLVDIDFLQFQRWFDFMGLQRHIKVLGIFSRLYLRDGKSGYLKDLPLVIRYVVEVSSQYPELSTFAEWFKVSVLPVCEKQDWYTDYRRAGEVAV